MTCELKTFELALNMFKFNLEGSLNFERRYSELDITVEHGIHILWMTIHELSFMNLQLDELS
jgi:hypothetical protein